MVLTPSTMLPLGTALPAFALEQVAGEPMAPTDAAGLALWSSTSLEARPVLVLFLCAHCPFVKHIERELSRPEHPYAGPVQLLAISRNHTQTPPQAGPDGHCPTPAPNQDPPASRGVTTTNWARAVWP